MNVTPGSTPTTVNAKAHPTRTAALQKYTVSRSNLLLMTVLTLLNLILLIAGSDTMLLFSATIPYLLTMTGIQAHLPVLIGLGIFLIVPYFLCWLFSKKHFGWIIAALVLFVFDTAAMAYLYLAAQDVSGVLDVLIHVWVLYYLIVGIRYGSLLRVLPEDPVEEPAEITPAVIDAPISEGTTGIKPETAASVSVARATSATATAEVAADPVAAANVPAEEPADMLPTETV